VKFGIRAIRKKFGSDWRPEHYGMGYRYIGSLMGHDVVCRPEGIMPWTVYLLPSNAYLGDGRNPVSALDSAARWLKHLEEAQQ